MARIFVKLAKVDPVYISNERARGLAKDKKAFEEKKIENTWMDVDNFHGYLSDIRSIVFDDERMQSNVKTTSFEPMTEKERIEQKKRMKEIRENVFGKNYKND